MDSNAVGWVVLVGLLLGAFWLGKKWNGGYRLAVAYRLELEQALAAEASARATAEARMAVGQSVVVNQGQEGGRDGVRLDRVEGAAAGLDAAGVWRGVDGWVAPGALAGDGAGTFVPARLAVEGVHAPAPAPSGGES